MNYFPIIAYNYNIYKPLNLKTMAKGIVTVTPSAGGGQLKVTVADTNPYRIAVNTILSFPNPSFTVVKDNTVNCTFTSATACTVTSLVLQPA